DFLRELNIAADDGVERVANHFFGDFAHAGKVDVGLDARVAENAQRALRDVDSLVADALEVVVDAGNRENEAEVDRHELMEGKELDDAIVDFELELVDGVFFGEDALGKLLIGIENGVDGLVDGAFGKATHPKEAILELVQIFFKMTFHVKSSSGRM